MALYSILSRSCNPKKITNALGDTMSRVTRLRIVVPVHLSHGHTLVCSLSSDKVNQCVCLESSSAGNDVRRGFGGCGCLGWRGHSVVSRYHPPTRPGHMMPLACHLGLALSVYRGRNARSPRVLARARRRYRGAAQPSMGRSQGTWPAAGVFAERLCAGH